MKRHLFLIATVGFILSSVNATEEHPEEIVNVLLIGEPGVGKSTIGNSLVKKALFQPPHWLGHEHVYEKNCTPTSTTWTSHVCKSDCGSAADGGPCKFDAKAQSMGVDTQVRARTVIVQYDDDPDSSVHKHKWYRVFDSPGMPDNVVERIGEFYERIVSFVNSIERLHAIVLVVPQRRVNADNDVILRVLLKEFKRLSSPPARYLLLNGFGKGDEDEEFATKFQEQTTLAEDFEAQFDWDSRIFVSHNYSSRDTHAKLWKTIEADTAGMQFWGSDRVKLNPYKKRLEIEKAEILASAMSVRNKEVQKHAALLDAAITKVKSIAAEVEVWQGHKDEIASIAVHGSVWAMIGWAALFPALLPAIGGLAAFASTLGIVAIAAWLNDWIDQSIIAPRVEKLRALRDKIAKLQQRAKCPVWSAACELADRLADLKTLIRKAKLPESEYLPDLSTISRAIGPIADFKNDRRTDGDWRVHLDRPAFEAWYASKGLAPLHFDEEFGDAALCSPGAVMRTEL